MAEPRTTVTDALAAWEANGPTSLTVALMADALYGVFEETVMCHHCGKGPDADGDHSCPCPLSNSACLEHTLNPVRATRVFPPGGAE